MISFDSKSIVDISYGNQPIAAVYYGNDLVWLKNRKNCIIRYFVDNIQYESIDGYVKAGDVIDINKFDGTYAGYVNIYPPTDRFKQFKHYMYDAGPFITRAIREVSKDKILTSYEEEDDKKIIITHFPEEMSCVYLSSYFSDELSIRYENSKIFDHNDIVTLAIAENKYYYDLYCNTSSADYQVDNSHYAQISTDDNIYSLTDLLTYFSKPVYNDLSIKLYSFYKTEFPLFIPTWTSVGSYSSINNALKKNHISSFFKLISPLYSRDDFNEFYPYMRLSVDVDSDDPEYQKYAKSFFAGLHGVNVTSTSAVNDTDLSKPANFNKWIQQTANNDYKFLYYEYEARKKAVEEEGVVEYPFVRMWYWSVNK